MSMKTILKNNSEGVVDELCKSILENDIEFGVVTMGAATLFRLCSETTDRFYAEDDEMYLRLGDGTDIEVVVSPGTPKGVVSVEPTNIFKLGSKESMNYLVEGIVEGEIPTSAIEANTATIIEILRNLEEYQVATIPVGDKVIVQGQHLVLLVSKEDVPTGVVIFTDRI